MNNCPFCNNEISNAVFASSPNFSAVYNIAPVFPGHSLIIPQKHIGSLLSLPENHLSEMIVFAQKVTVLLLEVFKSDGYNWSIQEGEATGQSVSHLHLHIVPRLNNDLQNPGDWYPLVHKKTDEILDSFDREKLNPEEMRIIVARLRQEAKITGIF